MARAQDADQFATNAERERKKAAYQAKLQLVRRTHALSTEIVRAVHQRFTEPKQWFLRSCKPGAGTIPKEQWTNALARLAGAKRAEAEHLFDQAAPGQDAISWRQFQRLFVAAQQFAQKRSAVELLSDKEVKYRSVLEDPEATSVLVRETKLSSTRAARVIRLQRQLVDSFLKSGKKGAGSVGLLKAFRRMDADRSGDLSYDEIKHFVSDGELGLSLPREVVGGLCEALDTKAKGSVSFQDFMDVIQPIRDLVDREVKGDSMIQDEHATTLEELGRASSPQLERTFWRIGARDQREGHKAIVTFETKEGRLNPNTKIRTNSGILGEGGQQEAKQLWTQSMPAEKERAQERLRERISFGMRPWSGTHEAKSEGEDGRLSHSVRPAENHHSERHAEAVGARREHLAGVLLPITGSTDPGEPRNSGEEEKPSNFAATGTNFDVGEKQRYADWKASLQRLSFGDRVGNIDGSESPEHSMKSRRVALKPPNARLGSVAHASELFVPPPSRPASSGLVPGSVFSSTGTSEQPLTRRSLLCGDSRVDAGATMRSRGSTAGSEPGKHSRALAQIPRRAHPEGPPAGIRRNASGNLTVLTKSTRTRAGFGSSSQGQAAYGTGLHSANPSSGSTAASQAPLSATEKFSRRRIRGVAGHPDAVRRRRPRMEAIPAAQASGDGGHDHDHRSETGRKPELVRDTLRRSVQARVTAKSSRGEVTAGERAASRASSRQSWAASSGPETRTLSATAAAQIIGGKTHYMPPRRLRGGPFGRSLPGAEGPVRRSRRGAGSSAPRLADSFSRLALSNTAEYDGREVALFRQAGAAKTLASRGALDAAAGRKPLHGTYRTEASDASSMGRREAAGLVEQGLVYACGMSEDALARTVGANEGGVLHTTGEAVHVDSERRSKTMRAAVHRQRLRRDHEAMIETGIAARDAKARLADVRRIRSKVRQRLAYQKRVQHGAMLEVQVVPAGSGLRGYVGTDETGREAVETDSKYFERGSSVAVRDAANPFAEAVGAMAASDERALARLAPPSEPRHRPRSVPATPHVAVRDGCILPDSQLRQADIRSRLKGGQRPTMEGAARPGAARVFPVCDASVFVGDTFAWFRHDV